ncbi:hypothetical protein Scep_028785 [Stephania cephalantha]|uniref:Senescence regulator n=1 Tax=Stephania cephalantha TaxID=152367 RepID=A0AAP0EEU6_9MAGN
MADVFGFLNKGTREVDQKSVRDEDFDEEDIWGVTTKSDSTIDANPKQRKPKDLSFSSSSSMSDPRRLPSASRMIPRSSNSSINESNKVVQQSAPVNIPDWSKIYKKNLNKSSNGSGFGGFSVDDCDDDDVVGIDGDEYDGKVPPHEWIARKLARSQISSFSVCEGVGRTLKGRDLSNVRDAILTRTGFIE